MAQGMEYFLSMLKALVSISSTARTKTKPLMSKSQAHINRFLGHNQERFIPDMQGWFNIQKSDNIIAKEIEQMTNPQVISIDTKEALEHSLTRFHDKINQQTRNTRELSQPDNGVYENLTSSIPLGGERLKERFSKCRLRANSEGTKSAQGVVSMLI
jgi:hypothetical protein